MHRNDILSYIFAFNSDLLLVTGFRGIKFDIFGVTQMARKMVIWNNDSYFYLSFAYLCLLALVTSRFGFFPQLLMCADFPKIRTSEVGL